MAQLLMDTMFASFVLFTCKNSVLEEIFRFSLNVNLHYFPQSGGEELVAKGATKIESTLPEVGQKDILPNGSWLEQKQIQAALEAQKCLIEVERIDKR
ncbi:hypothetical protein EVAR_80176_1 [Eumeta japonica]|uniref:Uncharacterized protein n=1 Tax=Eumeta variegata TaxID=151549 RepID=A0A4C1YBK1_EUMVA|nr:hypothetical protein EVAR_80176_1 [Eumeta japonica]